MYSTHTDIKKYIYIKHTHILRVKNNNKKKRTMWAINSNVIDVRITTTKSFNT